MRITSGDYPTIIFRNETDYGTRYNTGLSRKDKNVNWVNGSIPVKFRKGVSIPHKAKIHIKDAFLDFWIKEAGTFKQTVPEVFVLDYDLISASPDDYEAFERESMKIQDEDDLPF